MPLISRSFYSNSRSSARGSVFMTMCVLFLTVFQVPSAQAQDTLEASGDRHYIIGGAPVEQNIYPWMVALTSNNADELFQRQFCGGSVIADKWVLTAAHCLYDSNANVLELNTFKVAINTINLSDTDVEELMVTNVYVHPEYAHNADNPHSDIALLELATSSGVTPVTLSTHATANLIGLTATAIGWGAVENNVSSNPKYPVRLHLHSVQVPIVAMDVCNAPVSYDNAILPNQLCAGYPEGGRDSCTGDSGGPMVVSIDGVVQQAGIVSFGYGCALPDYYGIYTDVPYYIGWINQYIFVGEPTFEPELIVVKNGHTIDNSAPTPDLANTSVYGVLVLFIGLLMRRRA